MGIFGKTVAHIDQKQIGECSLLKSLNEIGAMQNLTAYDIKLCHKLAVFRIYQARIDWGKLL